jgi:hypothetical protein
MSSKTQKAGQTGLLRLQSYFACSAGTPLDQKERFKRRVAHAVLSNQSQDIY